jgi:hypothetical protein
MTKVLRFASSSPTEWVDFSKQSLYGRHPINLEEINVVRALTDSTPSRGCIHRVQPNLLEVSAVPLLAVGKGQNESTNTLVLPASLHVKNTTTRSSPDSLAATDSMAATSSLCSSSLWA